MEDLIARLYSHPPHMKGPALQAVESPDNRGRLIEAQKEPADSTSPMYGRYSRDSTISWDADDDPHPGDTIGRKGLQFTFSNRPKNPLGYLVGNDANACDIVLPKLPGISRKHCYFGFDQKRRLVLRDCSSQGTTVTYDGHGQKRRNFTWIIGGDEMSRNSGEIVIQLGTQLKFLIDVVVPTSPEVYHSNVMAFLRTAESDNTLDLGALGIKSTATTAAPTGTQTPRRDTILLERKELGAGVFGSVNHVWDVSTGEEYAVKTFFARKGSRDQSATWLREASLLRQCDHDHIVRLCFTLESPQYQLVMEYVPLGHLSSQNAEEKISEEETIIVLQQSLEALTYLHGRSPPIAHRDIKPENILVQSRRPLHIKLGDFGLSRAGVELQTFCGTPKYVAPEIAKYQSTRRRFEDKPTYSHAVDIWSLGVLALEYFYGLPDYTTGNFSEYCESLVACVDDLEEDDFVKLLSRMIVLDDKARPSADSCLESARKIGSTQCLTSAEASPSASVAVTCPVIAEHATLDCQIRDLFEIHNTQDTRKRKRSPSVIARVEAEVFIATQCNHNIGTPRSHFFPQTIHGHHGSTHARFQPLQQPDKRRISDPLSKDCDKKSLPVLSLEFQSFSHESCMAVHECTGGGTVDLPISFSDLERTNSSVTAALEMRDYDVRLRVRDIMICMKMDGSMDLLEILTVSQATISTRRRISSTVRQLTPEMGHDRKNGRIWLSHIHAKLISHYLGVTPQLLPLFDYAASNFSLPKHQGEDALSDHFQVFIELRKGPYLVAVRQRDMLVNVTHLLKTAHRDPSTLAEIVAELRASSNARVIELRRVPRKYSGLFVCYTDALRLCDDHEIPSLKEMLLGLTKGRGSTTAEPQLDALITSKENPRSAAPTEDKVSVYTEHDAGDFLPAMAGSWNLEAV